MSAQRLWAAILGTSMLFAAGHVWTTRSATRQMHASTRHAPDTTSVIDNASRALPDRDHDWAEPRLDLNGNEIDEAVGDYRIDARGEMYERHAPDTALLHLTAPRL